MVDKGDVIKIETDGEIVEEPDANLKKRKIGEPDINPGGASSLTADTHPRGKNLSKDPVHMRVRWRVVLRQSTTFCVTCQLSTSAEIELH